MIDKVGKRALFIFTSSVFVALSCLLTIFLVTRDFGDATNWSFLAPLVLLGLAYSIYAGALWSSIPYVVPSNTLGTAFGLATAV